MTLRSKLFATVAVPVLSAVVAGQPALAAATAHVGEARIQAEPVGTLVAQAETVTCADGSEAPDQETCDAIEAQAADDEALRQAEEQQAAEEEAQRQADEEAARQAEEQQAAEEEAARQAEQQAAEEEAARQAEEEAARQAEEQQAAEEAQRQADEEAARQAEEQQAAEEAQRQAEEEAARQAEEQEAARQAEQQAAEEEAARQAEEQQAAEEAERQAAEQADQDAQPADETQADVVTCADGSEAASEDECTVEATQPQAQEQTEEQAEQPAEAEQQQDEQAEKPSSDEEQQAEQPGDGDLRPSQDSEDTAGQEEQTDEQQAGEEPLPEGEQVVVPAVEPPEEQPVVEIEDTRTEEEKQAIAEDPGSTSETIVLPVEDGAAVLDSDKDADNSGQTDVREQRSEQREEAEVAPPPESDADAQADAVRIEPEMIREAANEQGTELNAAPTFQVPTTVVNNVTNVTNVTNNVTNNVVNQVTEVRVVEQVDNRTIINVGDKVVVRHDDRPRLRYDEERTYYEELSRGRVRETIERLDGSRLVTIYNRFGDIILRSRFSPRGEEYVLFYSPEADSDRPRMYVDVGASLPPMRLTVPVSDYIVTMSDEPDRDYYDFLARPPVERVERVYSIDEVKSSARLRDKVRRIDLDTITFQTGSAEVSLSQAKTLRRVAEAMLKILDRDPGEVFLIEGHTDAVGSDRSNLILSDERAETVANLLTEVYGIPPENMSTQGYGERYLKIRTQAAEEQNRRVTIRRVTPLVKPVASR
ncbi:OmpA family protein [Ciceribacter sp. L1K23]|uniref:OmpA family protein n=1 Tax=Ciceribacter sp. L1K23 TaxID=2820276 RepID=UPI001B81F82C|nr:OmpA family protein [Ciceribacter sp. L1K23]MBR0555232.1 OmpA family protein [Ciceribacter sp. L1K23]